MTHKEEITNLSKSFGSIDLLTACLMRNNGLSYEEAEDIALDLNSSDYVFDNFIEEILAARHEDDEEYEQ